MPSRKYKDLIKRAKGETTLQAEALARSKRIQEEYVRQMLEKRQRDLLAGAALKITQEQIDMERQQRVLQLLLGGRKGNVKKFFRAWVKGIATMKSERRNQERAFAWRRSCRCAEGEHEAACFHMALQDPVYQLPFDTMRQTGHAFFDRHGGSPGAAQHRHGSMAAAASMPDLLDHRTITATASGHHLPQLRDGVPPPPPPFLEGEVTAVAHHATGRKCFVDKMQRMIFAPEMQRSTLIPPSGLGGSRTAFAAGPRSLTATAGPGGFGATAGPGGLGATLGPGGLGATLAPGGLFATNGFYSTAGAGGFESTARPAGL